MSEISVSRCTDDGIVEIRAYGGSRRERGASIAAAVRRLRREGTELQRFYVAYDEMYGFQTMTWARYRGAPR